MLIIKSNGHLEKYSCKKNLMNGGEAIGGRYSSCI